MQTLFFFLCQTLKKIRTFCQNIYNSVHILDALETDVLLCLFTCPSSSVTSGRHLINPKNYSALFRQAQTHSQHIFFRDESKELNQLLTDININYDSFIFRVRFVMFYSKFTSSVGYRV